MSSADDRELATTEQPPQEVDDQFYDAAYEEYLDRMSELMLDKGLRESEPGASVRHIARARTLTALRRLSGDPVRKGELLKFLHDSGLITGETAIVDLRGADLQGADLEHAELEGAKLHGVHLQRARLNFAVLNGADMSNATVAWADMTGTFLKDANLYGTNFKATTLTGADLDGANMSHAFLGETKVTPAALAQVGSLERAKLPNGREFSADRRVQDVSSERW